MANNVDVKFRADGSQAKKEAQEVAREIKKAKEAGNGPGGPSGPVPGSGGKGAANPKDVAKKMGDEFGKVSGKSIGRALISFLGGRAAVSAIEWSKTPGANNVNEERAQAFVGGAANGAMMGAFAGPWGMAIGATAGSLLGLADEIDKTKKAVREATQGIVEDLYKQQRTTAIGLGSKAFDRQLEMAGGQAERQKLISRRMRDMELATGATSIRGLADRLNRYNAAGDVKSDGYKRTKDMFDARMAEYNTLRQQRIEESFTPLARVFGAGELGDSFSRKGLVAGAAVDVNDLNKQILDVNRQANEILNKMATQSAAGIMSLAKIEEALNLRGGLEVRL